MNIKASIGFAALAHVAAASAQMEGALGPQPMSREASGTSWQPEAASMGGLHFMGEEWMTMLHGYADVVYDHQGGPRGDEDVFVPGMLMGMAQRAAGPGTLGLKAMLSIDPLMGPEGYPLLFQTGETADGEEHLVDRQHPHDLFMELAASYSIPVGTGSVFGYVGLPGEPALGPAAFMHRASGFQIPEAPLTHHWLDSTHITFGVVTLGATTADWKLEASVFNGREPDENRWNIETRRLDSWSTRLTWNPDESWSAQLSYGDLESPEQLEPDLGVRRATASVSHTAALDSGYWATTLAAGWNREEGETAPGYVLESTRRWDALAVFARAEHLRNDHLVEDGPLAGREFGVGKLSVGASWRVAEAGPLAFELGALASTYRMPDALEAEYGSAPASGMVFLRTSLE